MQIISLSGVDGSGKSTQAQLLSSYLMQRGKKVRYFHATEFSLANRLFRKEKNFTPGATPAVTQASLLAVFARLFFLTLDGLRFPFYRLKLRAEGVEVLISDRFFQDSLINILYLSQNPFVKLKVAVLSWMLPRPDKMFYLALTLDELQRRGLVPEQGPEYVERKIALYESKRVAWHYIPINACATVEQIQREILSKLSDSV